MLDGSAVAQPNHISHWIESSITTEEFIKLLTQDTSCEDNSPLPTATSMLSDLSNKMTNMLIDCDSSQSQLSACDAGIATDLPTFDLPWTTLVNEFDASLYCASNRNLLTGYSSQTVSSGAFSKLSKQGVQFYPRATSNSAGEW